MNPLMAEINKLVRLYDYYITTDEQNKMPAELYLEEQYKCLANINKLIALSSTINIPNKVEKTNQINENLDSLEPIDIIIEEIKSWGVSEKLFIFRILTSIAKIKNYDCDYHTAIAQISEVLNTSPHIISTSFIKFIEKTDFSNSKYIPVLAKMPKDQITKEFIMEQLLDFCR